MPPNRDQEPAHRIGRRYLPFPCRCRAICDGGVSPDARANRRDATPLTRRMRNYWDAAIMARVRIWQIMPLAGPHRVVALIALGLALGALPLVFMIATSQMTGHVPDAVAGGLGSPAWDEVVRLFLIAAAAFVSSQILAPIQQMLGLAVQRSVDGHIRDQAVAAVTGSVGISALEDGEVLATFSEARMRFENNWHTPGNAVAGMLYLFARYTQLIGLLVVVWILLGPWVALPMAVGIWVQARTTNWLRLAASTRTCTRSRPSSTRRSSALRGGRPRHFASPRPSARPSAPLRALVLPSVPTSTQISVRSERILTELRVPPSDSVLSETHVAGWFELKTPRRPRGWGRGDAKQGRGTGTRDRKRHRHGPCAG